MCKKIVLSNYSGYKTNIYWNDDEYEVVEASREPADGRGGFTESETLAGIFVREEDLYFIWMDKEYKVNPDNFVCTNTNITTKSRCFKVVLDNKTVCEYEYEPFLSPFYPADGSDPEEFDFLLYLSNNIMKNKESLCRFKEGMLRIKQENII